MEYNKNKKNYGIKKLVIFESCRTPSKILKKYSHNKVPQNNHISYNYSSVSYLNRSKCLFNSLNLLMINLELESNKIF